MISAEMLTTTGVVSSKSAGPGRSRRKLYINPVTVAEKMGVIQAETERLSAMLDAVRADRVIRLTYEDLYSDPDRTRATLRRLCDFLNVPKHEPEVRMTRLGTRNPLDTLENGPEIREALADTRFACWLPDI
jgi:hypothetical protein